MTCNLANHSLAKIVNFQEFRRTRSRSIDVRPADATKLGDESLLEIEHMQKFWDEKLETKRIHVVTEQPTAYGDELLQDTRDLLSHFNHQDFVEASLREFNAHLAKYILGNS